MDLAAYLDTRDRSHDKTDPMPILVKGAVRADLPAFFNARGYTVGAEVGVLYGEFSEAICQGAPNVRLFCVDPWQAYPNAFARFAPFTNTPAGVEAAYEQAKARLRPYHCTFVRKYSPKAAEQFTDHSLDFVYIDANHWFENVVADLAAWLPKVRPGGILAGHDYVDHFVHDIRVATAVQAFTYAHGIRPWYVLGRVKIRPNEPTEKNRTFFWEVR